MKLATLCCLIAVCILAPALHLVPTTTAAGPPPSMKQYIVIAPAMVRPGKPYAFYMTLFEGQGYSVPVSFGAELVQRNPSPVGDVVLASQSFTQQAFGSQQFQFTSVRDPVIGSASNYTIRVTFSMKNVNLPQRAVSSSLVPAASENFAFIQTDKNVYRPGQFVYMTAFLVDRDLKPLAKNFTVSLKDSGGNLVGLWQNIRPIMATWSAKFSLPPMVNKGTWTIAVNSSSLPKTVVKTFDVDDYELPRFETAVIFPNGGGWLFSPDDEFGYTGVVQANYTFAKPVRGIAKLTLSNTGGCNLDYDSFDYAENPYSVTAQLYGDEMPDDGVFMATGLNTIIAPAGPDTTPVMSESVCPLTFIVDVIDQVSGTSLRTSGIVNVYQYKYRFDFVEPATDRPLSPGSIYSARVKVTPNLVDPNDPFNQIPAGTIVDLETVTFTQRDALYIRDGYCKPSWPGVSNSSQRISTQLATDDDGYVINANQRVDDQAVRIGFKVGIFDDSGYPTGQLCAIYIVNTDRAILISIDNSQSSPDIPKVGDVMPFRVSVNFPGDVYFLMASENSGNILVFKKLPASSFQTVSGAWQTAAVPQPLSSSTLAPRAVAVAWSVDPVTNKVLADVVSFKVDGLVRQNVTVSYSTTSGPVTAADANCPTRPKADRWLNVKTSEPGSLVSVLAIDKKVKLLPRNQQAALTNDLVLRRIDPGFADQANGLDASCWSCGAWKWWPADGLDLKNADNIFNSANMMIIVGNKTELSSGSTVRAGPITNTATTRALTADDAIVRRNLPEVWFWLFGITDGNGELHTPLRLPDTVTSWVTTAFAIGNNQGFGAMKTPVELVSRKMLFVDLVLPQNTVVYGEEFAATVAVYNYSPDDMSVAVTLEDLNNSTIGGYEASSDGGLSYSQMRTLTRTLVVPSNSARSFAVWIRPRDIGTLPMRVTAEGTSINTVGLPYGDARCDLYNDLPSYNKDILEVTNFNVEPEGKSYYANKAFFVRVSPSAPVQMRLSELDILAGTTITGTIVPDSKLYEVGCNGDLMGPVLTNLGDVVRMPAGCGEQLIKSMMPNAFVYKYYKATNQLVEPMKTMLSAYVMNWLPQLMSYQNPNGGFSVWGPFSPYPYNVAETWLTAFITRYLMFCSTYVDYFPTDRSAIDRSLAFLYTKINPNGTVTEASPLATHPEMKGGSWRDVNLAIYLYMTFAEAGKVGQATGNYQVLRQKVASVISSSKDPYQLALAGYATSLNDADIRELSSKAVNRLAQMATIKGSGDSQVIYWQPGDPALYPSPMIRPSAVETAGYALLAFLNNKRTESPSINRYLVSQRNSLGGFDQTQETVVGLHALSEYAAGIPNGNTPSGVTVTASFVYSSGYQTPDSTLIINASNAQVFQRISPPRRTKDELSTVKLTARGSGYVYCQVSMRYNVLVNTSGGDPVTAYLAPKFFGLNVNESRFLAVSSVPTTSRSGVVKRSRRAVVRGIVPNADDAATQTVLTRSVAPSTTTKSKQATTTTRKTTTTRTTTTKKPTTTQVSRTRTTPDPKSSNALSAVGIGDDVIVKVCISNATSDAKHGMVTMEVRLPSGFVADLEKTKRLNSLRYRNDKNTTTTDAVSLSAPASSAGSSSITTQILSDNRLQQIELGQKTIVYYFDLSVENGANAGAPCCVLANMYRQAQVRKTKMPYVTVFNYYRPVMNATVSYSFSNMAMPLRIIN